MQAKETKLSEIIQGEKQFVIPLFQRTYSWAEKEWDVLWKDIAELCDMENPRSHFIGSIVSMPTTSVPEGISKFLLIDGQQRLTTIFILLILFRNKAKQLDKGRLAEEINNISIVNQYKEGSDYYKLLPTQADRDSFLNLIDEKVNSNESQIQKAYHYFEKKLKQIESTVEIEQLKKIVTIYFSIVSITLDADDNPYLVFESLNAKGRPLTQADLIRNYIFMRIHVNEQNKAYETYWMPMQTALKDSLTEFIRHYLMKDGSIVKQSDIYYALKDKITPENATKYLKELSEYAVYYQRLKFPECEPEKELQRMFKRLNRIEVTTAYPLLLNFYNIYNEGAICATEFCDALNVLENYLIRRYVCNIPTNQLNKIFPLASPFIKTKYSENILEGLKVFLLTKGYPKDAEFALRFRDAKLYGGGDRAVKTKLILETIEHSFNHKETVSFDDLTIEHIMPQTLSEWWQNHLGSEWGEIHDLSLHTSGNLTLTAYNTEMSNDDFNSKKQILSESHLEMNKYFDEIENWNKEEIEKRSEHLSQLALQIWGYFGEEDIAQTEMMGVTGTTPDHMKILGQNFSVNSWRDVMEKTLNVIAYLEPDKMEIIAKHFPRFVSKDKSKLKATRKLECDYYIEVNLSAKSIQRFCQQAIETIELTGDDWRVIVR